MKDVFVFTCFLAKSEMIIESVAPLYKITRDNQLTSQFFGEGAFKNMAESSTDADLENVTDIF